MPITRHTEAARWHTKGNQCIPRPRAQKDVPALCRCPRSRALRRLSMMSTRSRAGVRRWVATPEFTHTPSRVGPLWAGHVLGWTACLSACGAQRIVYIPCEKVLRPSILGHAHIRTPCKGRKYCGMGGMGARSELNTMLASLKMTRQSRHSAKVACRVSVPGGIDDTGAA